MFPQSKLDRINELAHIAKERELTAAELAERDVLRKEYIEDFRGRFKEQLKDIEVVDPDDPRLGGKPMAKVEDVPGFHN